MASWTRLTRLRWLKQALTTPADHTQALCALFGTLPWDPTKPTTKRLPYLALLATDLEAAFGGSAIDNTGHIKEEYLTQLTMAPDTTLQKVLSYHSQHERGSTKQFGPPNAPTHSCTECHAAFDTAQKLAVHRWAAHKRRNPWRSMVTEAQCPYCQGTFASVEVAKRHVVNNVCGLRPQEPPPATLQDTLDERPGPHGTLEEWLRRQ